MAVAKTLVSTTSVAFDKKTKTEVILRPGDKLKATDPLVKGREALFEVTPLSLTPPRRRSLRGRPTRV
jgi:hypothetical protein